MTAEQTISERIEAVLAAHEWTWAMATPTRPILVCSCGDELISATSSVVATLDDHRAHVTTALLAAGILQEVEAEALRTAADEGPLHFAATHTGRDARGWNVVEADWLRDRADSIVQGRRDGGAP